jgi:hypothetical protein
VTPDPPRTGAADRKPLYVEPKQEIAQQIPLQPTT